ncbi:hypothetical protein [Allomesorhizobium alhagi]|uniref:DUF1579 domain-containing protein n=1 Tax=Mesorhizobium alhagi CCNWXJ12-2 TaxID=1107882 RepID=H0HY15_9HYPH|nr:hypothetical protein [Mesorhizobium alhagi]EHK54381.1 hypothetical protein MAXJ12_25468 [Mesorhizobium alhagi CCNWXJ12-2]
MAREMQSAPSAPSGQGDFDFLFGQWRVADRRLAVRLAGSNDWLAFDGVSATRPILGGQANIEDNILNSPAGTYRAAAIRAFDPAPGQWAIWWLDSRYPDSLGTPVVGRFENGVGTFYSDDMHEGRPVRTRFLWTQVTSGAPRWEQALSADGGTSWETNWIMNFTRTGD